MQVKTILPCKAIIPSVVGCAYTATYGLFWIILRLYGDSHGFAATPVSNLCVAFSINLDKIIESIY